VSALARVFRRSPYDREILRLALPALGALAADPLVSLVDTAYVGRLGTQSLGALAVAAALFGVAFSVFNFLSYGTTPLVARELGRGNGAGAGRITVAAAVIGGVLGVVVMSVLLGIPQPLLRVLGAGPDLIDPAATYLRIRAFALPAVLCVMVGHGVFRGAQDTRTPFLIALGLNAVNLILDPVLIFGFDLGLPGAAWATVVAQWLGAAGFVVMLARRRQAIGLTFALPGWTDAKALGGAGHNLVIRTASLLIVFTASTAVAARLGEVPVAAHQIVLQLFIFLSLVLDAIAIAAQAMLGTATGARDPVMLRTQADRLVGLGIVAGLGLGALLTALSPWLGAIFTADEAVVTALRGVYPQLVLVQVIGGAVFAWDGIVIGATDFRFAMISTTVPAVVATAALLPIVPLGGSLGMVWWAVVLLMVLRAALLTWWHGARLERAAA
jgi:MATE family multidrug resistance protein